MLAVRGAFTIVELLVVVAILLALSSLALAVYHANSGSERTRSGARVAQATLLGAKDRAAHAKEARGVRLIRDMTDPGLVTGFAYVAPIIPQPNGSQANSLLPFHQPMPLPGAVVIDLDNSSASVQALCLSGPVQSGSGTTVAADIDIMYSPRGMLTGPVTALGPLHFLLNNIRDASANLNPIDPRNTGDKLVLTVFPQTGLVATFPIDPTDANHDGFADDLFHFAKLGIMAAQ